MSKPQIAIRLSPSLLQELNNYVELTGTSKTDVVVSALAIANRRYHSLKLL
ncbi:MAG: hypothetical protein ACK4YS_09235 [Aphanizomenon sp.]